MRVSRLEIFGFKSFVERFVLNFDKNFIGIVGPNGCGKSNIVDALRWVLGETHAKQLRGGVLEDLIFNGSDSRRPLGMAEVSITVRPHEGWAPATVLRLQELARSDKGEFEASSETSDIESTEVVAAPDSIVEAAKGATASTLLQLPGLFDSAEIQLTRRLYRSGESEYFLNRLPCRLRDMVEFYRLIGLGSRGLSIVQQGQVGGIISSKPEELRVLIEEAAGVSGFRSRINVAERRVDKTIENLSRLKDITLEVEKQVRSLQRQAKRASERGALKEELNGRELEYYKLRGSLIVQRDEALSASEQALEDEIAQLRVTIENLNVDASSKVEEITSIDESLKDEREKRELLSTSLREKRKREQQLQQTLAKLESSARSNQFQVGDLSSRDKNVDLAFEKLSQDKEQALVALKELEIQKSSVQKQLQDTLNKIHESEPELEQIKTALNSLKVILGSESSVRENLKQIEVELHKVQQEERELERQYSGKKGELRSAESQIISIKRQLTELTKSASDGIISESSEIGQVVLSGIKVPVGYEKAVAAVLGERSRYLVANDPTALLMNFKASSKQKAAGVLKEVTVTKAVSADERLLVNKLHFEDWVKSTAQDLLADTYFAEDIEGALALLEELGSEISVVTKDGVIVGKWGWSISGEKELHSFRLARLLAEEEAKLEGCKNRIDELSVEQGLKRKSLEELVSKRDGFRQELLTFDKTRSEIAQLVQRERELERKQFERRVSEERQVQELLREASSKCSSAQSRVDFITKGFSDLEFEKNRIASRREELAREWKELEEEFTIVSEHLAEEVSSEILVELESLTKLIEKGVHNIEFSSKNELEAELLKVEGALYEKEAVIRKLRSQVRIIDEEKSTVGTKIERKSGELQQVKLQTERGKVELELLRTEVDQKFGTEFELSLQEQFRSFDIKDLEQEVTKSFVKIEQLRARLAADGEIDPAVIEQYQVERERLVALEAQLVDLEAAQKSLERSIRHLRELSRQKFVETFQDVSRRFGDLIPKLFGGGFGEMNLSIPEDPLNTGVVITVRPPGKKLRSLELLSGGEKALSAAAVLLAMFLHRPSPICVLDEVDAPLDDANLERFLSLIKEISQSTQLLMITHNKQSMLASDRLIGITMQEPGVSKALSVSFEEAEQELERIAANG
jgi:chromosome segregation protein